MQKKNILLLLGHPYTGGMCGALADAYEQSAKEAGHTVTRMNIGGMKFDPVLWQGYRERQELEPDLRVFQSAITVCDHFVVIFPLWWVGMPAILKGLFDRAWLPNSAFRYIKTREGKRTIFWERLFRGKTARIIVTSGTPPWMVRFLPGTGMTQLRWGILWFAGFSVRSSWFGPAENVSEEKKEYWVETAGSMGERAA